MTDDTDDAAALAAFFDQRDASRAADAQEVDAPESAVTFEVVGKHRVHGIRRGGTLDLDPESPQTRRLVEAGHIRPVTGADTQEASDG